MWNDYLMYIYYVLNFAAMMNNKDICCNNIETLRPSLTNFTYNNRTLSDIKWNIYTTVKETSIPLNILS